MRNVEHGTAYCVGQRTLVPDILWDAEVGVETWAGLGIYDSSTQAMSQLTVWNAGYGVDNCRMYRP